MAQVKTRKRKTTTVVSLRKIPDMTGRQLQRWRLSQINPETGKPATALQAAQWYGASIRGWQYWEAAGRPPGRSLPMPLRRRIALGHRIFERSSK